MVALVIAMVMVVAMSMTAYAVDPVTEPTSENTSEEQQGGGSTTPTTEATTINVTVNGNEHDTFTAVPIFLGTQANTADNQPLGDVVWADPTKATALTTAIAKVVPAAAGKTTALDVAKAIADANLSTADAEKLAKALYEVLKNATGTALTNEGTNEVAVGWYLVLDGSTLGDNDALNPAVLQFTKDITISKKTDAPSQEKKVKEDTTYTDKNGYNDVADYDIGEEVPFQITSKIPDISKFTKYEMTFTDQMSSGLTFTPSSIKVTIGSTEYDATAIASNENIVLTKTDDQNFTVKLVLKKQNTDKLSGTNTAIFAEGADIKIDFTATLNSNAVIGLDGNTNKSKLTYTSSPNATDEEDSNKDTPWDTVIVFTYELDVTKVDGEDNTKKLEGAEFVLKNAEGKFAKVNATTNRFESWEDAQADGTTFTTPANGEFKILGLDEGTYSLVETKAPTGYNKIDPIAVVVSAEYITDRQAWEDAVAANALKKTLIKVDDGEATQSEVVGVLKTDVENNKGVVLPETGGIGTTIFYVVGAILVLGAGILLVTRRRMSAN